MIKTITLPTADWSMGSYTEQTVLVAEKIVGWKSISYPCGGSVFGDWTVIYVAGYGEILVALPIEAFESKLKAVFAE
jgi:hypothetical protein